MVFCVPISDPAQNGFNVARPTMKTIDAVSASLTTRPNLAKRRLDSLGEPASGQRRMETQGHRLKDER